MATVALTQLLEAAPSASAAGDVLSPSQVRTFCDCSARWMFKYLLRLPDVATGNMALGSAVHEALAYNFEQKISSGRDLETGDVVEQFDCEFDATVSEAELRDEENVQELAAAGRALVAKYMAEAAPSITPAAVELDLAGHIGGVEVVGVVDLVESNGRIRDYKVHQRKVSALSNDQVFQLSTYVELVRQAREAIDLPEPTGDVQIDSLVRTKTPQLNILPYTVKSDEITSAGKIYSAAQHAMQSDCFVPNRGSMLCSRRNCSFWRACEQQYGGHIE